MLATALAASPLDGCREASSVEQFAAAATAGELAFADLDLPGLLRAGDDAARALTCLDKVVGTRDAAAFHRLLGLIAFTRHDLDDARSEFHAARRLDPSYQIPESVAPPGHPLVALYDESALGDEGQLEPVQAAGGGWIVVDGVRGSPRPTGISVVLQRLGPTGVLEGSLFLPAGAALPDWALPPKAISKRRIRTGLLIGSGVSAAGAVASYGLAWSAHQQFWNLDDPAPDNELAGLRSNANTLTYTSAGLGVVALGLASLTVAIW